MLEACNLTLDGRLDDVSAVLQQCRITAICGPNGAGKSTLLQTLAGLLQTTAGQVLLDGQPLSAVPAKDRARAIGHLPQSSPIAWDLSVQALVTLGRLPHGDKGAEEVQAALAATDMEQFAKRPISTLSGGETARALLARVLAGQPRFILADEPLAALDLRHQLAMVRQLRAAAQAGAGVVLVLHDLALAMNHADHVLVLEQGRAVQAGPPEIALSEAVITQVWQTPARWLGQRGARALAVV